MPLPHNQVDYVWCLCMRPIEYVSSLELQCRLNKCLIWNFVEKPNRMKKLEDWLGNRTKAPWQWWKVKWFFFYTFFYNDGDIRYIKVPYLGLHNVHLLLALKISRKKLVRVYNAHGLLKQIVVGNVRIKYQSYIFFSPLSMFHLLGEFKNHLSLFIFNKVAKY